MNKAPLTDGEHHAVVCRYREWRSMAKVAKAYRISPATVLAHIQLHNMMINDISGNNVCEKCWNAGDYWVAHEAVLSREERRYWQKVEEEERRLEAEGKLPEVVAIPIDEWRRMERERVNKIMQKNHEVVHQEQENGV